MIDRVVIINDDVSESGGASVIALASAKLLRQRGLEVTVLAGSGDFNPGLSEFGVDVITAGGRHLLEGNRLFAAGRGLYSTKHRAFIAAWIRANDTPHTIYHLHNWHKVLSPSVFIPLRKVANRLIASAHDYFMVCPNGGYYHYPKNQICHLTPMHMPCLLASCDKRHYAHKLWRVARHTVRSSVFKLHNTRATILAVHEGMSPYLQRGGVEARSITVLRNPIIPWCPERVKAELNSDVFFVGRLEVDKGVDVLAKATQMAGLRLRVIGEGPLRRDLTKDFPHVELLGQRTRQEITNMVGSARFIALPTRWPETFGLVAVEALMSGIPVLASTSALITPEIVRLGLGLACQPGDPADLAKKLKLLAQDDEMIATMSQRAFMLSPQLAPTAERWCDELIALYERKLTEAPVQ